MALTAKIIYFLIPVIFPGIFQRYKVSVPARPVAKVVNVLPESAEYLRFTELIKERNQRIFKVSPVQRLVPVGNGLKKSLEAMLKLISGVVLVFSRLSTLSKAIEKAE